MSSELKRTLCNELIDKGLVEENDVIRHSYTRNRLNNGIENMGRTESKSKLSPTLDTRCDCLGVVVKEPSKLQKEVGNQAMEKGLMKPYDIIDYTYKDNHGTVTAVVEPNLIGGIGEKKSNNGTQHYQQDRVYDDSLSVCLATQNNPYYATQEQQSLRIRKLTPKECWRLMGFDDTDFEKAEKVCSNSQLYKQAGNSIVVNVLMAIFKELFKPKKTRSEWLDELLN